MPLHARRSLLVLLTAGLVLALAAVGCADPEAAEGFDPEVATGVEDVTERGAEASAAGVLVHVDAPAGALSEAEGLPEVDEDADAIEQASFRVASITKPLTATVILQLVEEGALDLNDRLGDLLPRQAARFEHGEEITVRQLLTHTSGLRDFVRHPDYLPGLVAAGEVEGGVAVGSCDDLAGIDPLGYVEGEAAFAPGTGYEYSNAGYVLAGQVIEEVTDGPLEEAYRERILEPLGMDRTWLACEEEPRSELVRGFHAPGSFGFTIPGQGDELVDVTDVEDPNLWASGGLASTAEDLTLFARALFTGELFEEPASLDEMLEPTDYAEYGLGVRDYGGAHGHSGLAAGYGTHLRYDPAGDTVVVVMVNETAVELPTLIGSEVADLVG